MYNILSFTIRIQDGATSVIKGLNTGITALNDKGSKLASMFSRIGSSYLEMNQMKEAFQGINEAMGTISAPAMAFEDSMAELKAITGVTGEQFEQINDNARQLSVTFGGSAAQAASGFTNILSKLGVGLAESPEALNNMGQSMMTLSKAMGNDVNGAMEALTNSMLQYNVSMDNPVQASEEMRKVMNMLAQSAVLGSAKVTQISQSLKVAGTAAYQSNVSFAEANAALQVLGKGALYGAEAGTGLRNVLLKLGEGEFMPKESREGLIAAGVDMAKLSDKSIPLAERLKELQKVQGDSALISQVFGMENSAAANILLSNVSTLEDWTGKMTGTNAATEAANIQMGTMSERLRMLKAKAEDFGISVFNAIGSVAPLLGGISQAFTLYGQLSPLLKVVGDNYDIVVGKIGNFVKNVWSSGVTALSAGWNYAVAGVKGVGSFVLSLFKADTYMRIHQTMLTITGGVTAWFARMQLQASLVIGLLSAKIKAVGFSGLITGFLQSGLQAARSGALYVWSSVTGLGSYIVASGAALWATIALNAAMYANPIGLVVAGLVAIGLAIYAIVANWDWIKGWLWSVAEFFMKYNPFSLLMEGIYKLFPSLRGTLGEWLGGFKAFFEKIFGWLKGVWDGLKKILGFNGELNLNVNPENPGDLLGASGMPGGYTPTGESPTGITPPSNLSTPTNQSTSGSGGTTKGGNVSITLQNLVGTLNITVADISELRGTLEDEVLDIMSRALNRSQMNVQ